MTYPAMNDSELLEAWAADRDEAAFAELVRRYLDMVYASALRQVRDAPMAKDIAQAVFLVLSRKAGSLGSGVVLSGWLFQTTRFVAARALRTEQRRIHHENQVSMHPPDNEPSILPEHWAEVEPHLDAALAALSETDRRAVLLRFLENQPLRLVGERLGVGEEAAKKRVSRAVEKLRVFLGHRGVALTVGALSTLLLNLPTTAAPVGLSGEISMKIIADGVAPISIGLAVGALRDQFRDRVRQLIPWAAAALALLLVGGRFWTQSTESAVPALVAVAAQATDVPTETPEVTTSPENAKVPDLPGPSRILINVRAADDDHVLVARGVVEFWSRFEPQRRQEVVADNQGIFDIPVAELGFESITVWLSAPGYVPVSLQWKHHEFVEPLLLYSCRMQPGQKLQGTAQDEAGQPVSGARIQFNGPGPDRGERENIEFLDDLSSVVTDADGRFVTEQLPKPVGNQMVGYSVLHPEFVRGSVTLTSMAMLQTNQPTVLKTGLFVRGRVLGPDQRPIADVTVEEDPTLFLPHGRSISASDGTFRLGPFSPGPIRISASAAGYRADRQSLTLDPTAREIVVSLERADREKPEEVKPKLRVRMVRIAGEATDAESGEPLRQFRVRIDELHGSSMSLVGEGHDGHFEWPLNLPFCREFTLQVDADGYEATASDIRQMSNETQHFKFKMRRGGTVSGSVIDQYGRPVAGALVGLNGVGFNFIVGSDGRAISGNDAPQTMTDDKGHFSLRRGIGTETVLIVHESGWAFEPVEKVTRATLSLAPWGSIAGTLQVNGEPAAGQKVTLAPSLPENDTVVAGVNVQGWATTDAAGRFRFERVPGGSVQVSRYFNFNRSGLGEVGIGAPTQVKVVGGKVAEIIVASPGRAIIGRLSLARPIPGFDWRDDLQRLVQVREDLPPVEIGGMPRKTQEYVRSMRAGQRYNAKTGKHFLTIQPDGAFRIDDVPPGQYRLQLSVRRPPVDPTSPVVEWDRQPELGKLVRPITVPEADGTAPTIDLGDIVIPVP